MFFFLHNSYAKNKTTFCLRKTNVDVIFSLCNAEFMYAYWTRKMTIVYLFIIFLMGNKIKKIQDISEIILR